MVFDLRQLCPQGNLGGATGIYWVQVMDAVEHSTMYKTVPTTKNSLAPNVEYAKAEKF